jgi:hypothetical protein
MKKPTTKIAGNSPAKRTANSNSAEATFGAYPKPVKAKLLALRRLIFDTAKATEGVGALEEALKWGQPSYLTTDTKSGSTIRIDQVKEAEGQYAVYFHCPDRSGRDLSRALSGTALWRQPEHSAQRRGKASRSRVAPLRGAGVDVSFTEAKIGEGEIGVTAAHTTFPI